MFKSWNRWGCSKSWWQPMCLIRHKARVMCRIWKRLRRKVWCTFYHWLMPFQHIPWCMPIGCLELCWNMIKLWGSLLYALFIWCASFEFLQKFLLLILQTFRMKFKIWELLFIHNFLNMIRYNLCHIVLVPTIEHEMVVVWCGHKT
jgi:hypothetical protein